MKIPNNQVTLLFRHLGPLFFARAFFLLAAIAFILFLRSDIVSRAKTGQENRVKLEAISAKLTQETALRQQYESLKIVTPKLHALFPDIDDLARFRGDMEALALAEGLNVKVTYGGEPASSASVPGYEEIPLTLKAGGTGDALAKFFERIARMSYFVRLNEITIEAQGGLDGTSTLNAGGTLVLKPR